MHLAIEVYKFSTTLYAVHSLEKMSYKKRFLFGQNNPLKYFFYRNRFIDYERLKFRYPYTHTYLFVHKNIVSNRS